MEANYPVTWNHRNHLIRRTRPPIPRPRREQLHGRAITNKVLQWYRYLGQGRSIALDTVAYRAQVGLQLMVQFSRPRVRDPRVNPSEWNDEPVNRLPTPNRQGRDGETRGKKIEKWESEERKIDEGAKKGRGRGNAVAQGVKVGGIEGEKIISRRMKRGRRVTEGPRDRNDAFSRVNHPSGHPSCPVSSSSSSSASPVELDSLGTALFSPSGFGRVYLSRTIFTPLACSPLHSPFSQVPDDLRGSNRESNRWHWRLIRSIGATTRLGTFAQTYRATSIS